MCYVCATYVSLLWSMRDVLRVLGILLWRSKRILMLLYIYCFRFSEVMDQVFQGALQGSFRATLGVAAVFVHVVLRPGWGSWRCPPHLGFFSSRLSF